MHRQVQCWFRLPERHPADGTRFACCPPKNGGTSFYRSLFNIGKEIDDRYVYSEAVKIAAVKGVGPYTPEEASSLVGAKIMAVRDPVERFRSLWADKCARLDPNYPHLYGKTFDDLLATILMAPTADPHWMPQWMFDVRQSHNIRHNTFLSHLSLREVRANRTDSVVLTGDIADAVRRHYARDVDYYWEIYG